MQIMFVNKAHSSIYCDSCDFLIFPCYFIPNPWLAAVTLQSNPKSPPDSHIPLAPMSKQSCIHASLISYLGGSKMAMLPFRGVVFSADCEYIEFKAACLSWLHHRLLLQWLLLPPHSFIVSLNGKIKWK